MRSEDPCQALRAQGATAPWSVAELAALADRLLHAAGVAPARPTTERTVRYYVSRQVVSSPFGRGPGSTWGYPHLVELLAARLALHEAESLDAAAARRSALDAAALERHAASRLDLPTSLPTAAALADEAPRAVGTSWHRFAVADGVELHLAGGHPLAADSRRLGALLDDLAREVASPAPES
jgi:hypothetical protein